MSNRIILILTVIHLIGGNAPGQIQFESVDSVINFLVGDWLWTVSCGGIMGERKYPDSATSKSFVFSRHESRHARIVQCHYRNDTLVDSGNAEISFSNSMYGKCWHLDRFTSLKLALFFISEDEIKLAEHCHDCYEHYYTRKKVPAGTRTDAGKSALPARPNPGSSFRPPASANEWTAVEAAIVTMQGRLVRHVDDSSGEFYTGHLHPGHYLIRVGTYRDRVVKKIVIRE